MGRCPCGWSVTSVGCFWKKIWAQTKWEGTQAGPCCRRIMFHLVQERWKVWRGWVINYLVVWCEKVQYRNRVLYQALSRLRKSCWLFQCSWAVHWRGRLHVNALRWMWCWKTQWWQAFLLLLSESAWYIFVLCPTLISASLQTFVAYTWTTPKHYSDIFAVKHIDPNQQSTRSRDSRLLNRICRPPKQ